MAFVTPVVEHWLEREIFYMNTGVTTFHMNAGVNYIPYELRR